ncbi:pimeloyl-ACP methyl ester carboxylesterase [Mesorhizobium soli]|uniref:alpha/beta hydrolase family protein n=1 Tax=Pseudaminobacter soli (ex Li et al. 2025) TaxID=1295366 RepID=UPI0024758041|nr:hypothetical protein [Mesorhizobium soli]MDH6232982.1 pimeloyl-ACP methyl ester carboxylesterase [Mesorhizobium soli]
MTRNLRYLRSMAFVGLVWAAPALTEPQLHETPRADGSTIHWTLDRPEGDGETALVVIAQGSGCAPAMASLSMRAARAAFAGLAALTVEKYGVDPKDSPANDHLDCSQIFRERHTVSQRIADYRQIVESLRGAPWWNGKLILFGGSEGGMTMAALAADIRADIGILVSTGGGVTFGEEVRQAVPEDGRLTADAAFAKARQNPDSAELWAGQSLKYWADGIDRRPVDDMLRADTEFLLIQGARDASTSVNTARMVSDLFAKDGRCNLTYWEFPAFDHGMVDAAGKSHMAEVLSQAALWRNARMDMPVTCPAK